MQEQVKAETPAPKDWWSSGTASVRPTQVTVPVLPPDRSQARNIVLSSLILVGGGVTMLASTLPWITATILRHTASVDGTDQAITKAITTNGWVTLGGGAALVVLGALMIVAGERVLRWLTILVGMGTTGFAVYDLVRIVQKTDQANAQVSKLGSLAFKLGVHSGVGYGLIILVAAASATLILAMFDAGGTD
jgi:hypothetical protein